VIPLNRAIQFRVVRPAIALGCGVALLCGAVPVGGLGIEQVQAEQPPEELFGQAVGLFQGGQYREAIAIFRKVFEKDPNPFVLFNIGRCYQELGELEDAARYYQRSVSLEGLPREAKVDALMRLENLEDVLKERSVMRAARTEAHVRVDRGLFVAARSLGDGPVTSSGSSGDHVWTWVGAGIAAVGLGVTVGGGVVYSDVESNLDRQSELAEIYRTTGNDALRTDDAAKARTARQAATEVNALADTIEGDQLLSGVLFTVGGALVVGGATLIVLDQLGLTSSGEEATSLYVVPTGQGVGLVGRF